MNYRLHARALWYITRAVTVQLALVMKAETPGTH